MLMAAMVANGLNGIKQNYISYYDLCQACSTWIYKSHFKDLMWKYVIIGLKGVTNKMPDIYAVSGLFSLCVEVKMTRGEFTRSLKKKNNLYYDNGCGTYRYYLCPDGVININELPDGWGLINYNYDEQNLTIVKESTEFDCKYRSDMMILSSFIKKLGIKSQIFNFLEQKK